MIRNTNGSAIHDVLNLLKASKKLPSLPMIRPKITLIREKIDETMTSRGEHALIQVVHTNILLSPFIMRKFIAFRNEKFIELDALDITHVVSNLRDILIESGFLRNVYCLSWTRRGS